MNLPSSWARMTDHAKACYLCETHQAKGYAQARKQVWRMDHPKPKAKVLLTESVRRPDAYWWNRD